MNIFVNGSELNQDIYNQVVEQYADAHSALWVERHDFMVDLDANTLVENVKPVENVQVAMLQKLELERIDEEEIYFSRRGAGSLS